MARSYLGVGIKYPYSIDEFGAIELQSDKDLVKQSIIRILSTKKGSVFFNRKFGSYVSELLFEPNDTVLFELLDFHIIEAIEEWEKRVEIISNQIKINELNSKRIDVVINYRILASNEVDSFIYPFYRELKY